MSSKPLPRKIKNSTPLVVTVRSDTSLHKNPKIQALLVLSSLALLMTIATITRKCPKTAHGDNLKTISTTPIPGSYRKATNETQKTIIKTE